MSRKIGIIHPHFQIDVFPSNIYPIAKKLIGGEVIEADFTLDILFNTHHKSPTNLKGLSIKLQMSNQKHFPFNDTSSKTLTIYTNEKPIQQNLNLKITFNSLFDKAIGIQTNNNINFRYTDGRNRIPVYYKLEATYLGQILGKKYVSTIGTFELVD